MTARFEVVRTDAGWHIRLVSGNGATVLTSENYTRMIAAERAILAAARLFGWPHLGLHWNVRGVEKVFVGHDGGPLSLPTVRYIDERTQP